MPAPDWIGRGRWGEWGAPVGGAAWNRRAPVKVPPAPLPGLLGVPTSHHLRSPRRGLSWAPKYVTWGVRRGGAESAWRPCKVPGGPGRSLRGQPQSEGTWAGRVRRSPSPCFPRGRRPVPSGSACPPLSANKACPPPGPDRLPCSDPRGRAPRLGWKGRVKDSAVQSWVGPRRGPPPTLLVPRGVWSPPPTLHRPGLRRRQWKGVRVARASSNRSPAGACTTEAPRPPAPPLAAPPRPRPSRLGCAGARASRRRMPYV